MLIYRDSSAVVPSRTLREELRASLGERPLGSAALIRAGVLESALADLGAPSAERASALTDAIADAWLDDRRDSGRASALLETLELPAEVSVKRPEGYAFYALDPRAYRELAADHARTARRPALVIGVRSIGTSLSAVVRAELSRASVPAQRLCVRPTGHPWQRALVWSERERATLARAHADAAYLVVDEGPGLSGSTFLAVGEALLELGVPAERIEFFTSHSPDPERLRAEDAKRRWARFRCRSAPPFEPPAQARDVSGGRWRERLFSSRERWPPCWAERERVKFLQDGALVKFAGFPPYGEGPHARAKALAEAGFAPSVRPAAPGFVAYEWIAGRAAERGRDRDRVLERLPAYLAFRAARFNAADVDPGALAAMARLNTQKACGVELPSAFSLEVRTPLLPDGQLTPHEWIVAGDRVLKTDGVDHGDEHLFPGPTDVAWDLAGAIVEWDLDAVESARLLGEFERLRGDRAHDRILPYVIAYSSFRAGVASYAAESGDAVERGRWREAGAYYRRRLGASISALASS